MANRQKFNEAAVKRAMLGRQLLDALKKPFLNESECLALLKKGADPNVTDAEGNSPLILAAGHSCQLEIVYKTLIAALIKKGAKIDHANNAGMTAPKLAVCYYYIPVLDFIGKACGREYRYADYRAFLDKGGMQDHKVKLPYHRIIKTAKKPDVKK